MRSITSLLSFVVLGILVLVLSQTPGRSEDVVVLSGRVEGKAQEGKFPLAFHFFDKETHALVHRAVGDLQVHSGSYEVALEPGPLSGGGEFYVCATSPDVEMSSFQGQAADPWGLVRLQPSTPGVQQTGHVNISGTLIAGAIKTNSFQMSTGAASGSVLTSDASGNGTWQALPPPNGAAGGDLSGTYPNPLVDGLQGFAVASTAPSIGQVLKWNGSAWSPSTDLQDAFWQATGNNIYYTTGNVGIGLSSPAYALQVQAATGDRAVYGLHTAGSGFVNGGWFESASTNGRGVVGYATANSGGTFGVWGQSDSEEGIGVYGLANAGSGITFGAWGQSASPDGFGVVGTTTATSGYPIGVWGSSESPWGYGVYGYARAYAVFGDANTTSGYGVFGTTQAGGTGYGVYFMNGLAGTGTKSFQMDHPLRPETHYLNHFCTESPEPYNAYSGNVVTDARGYATVQLPDYFESINRDFRYQLTIVDDGEREDFVLVKVVRKIRNNQFTIRTSAPHVEVSWRVEAIRNDLWVQKYGFKTEQEKPEKHQGKYLSPELYGMPKEYGIHYRPNPEERKTGELPDPKSSQTNRGAKSPKPPKPR